VQQNGSKRWKKGHFTDQATDCVWLVSYSAGGWYDVVAVERFVNWAISEAVRAAPQSVTMPKRHGKLSLGAQPTTVD